MRRHVIFPLLWAPTGMKVTDICAASLNVIVVCAGRMKANWVGEGAGVARTGDVGNTLQARKTTTHAWSALDTRIQLIPTTLPSTMTATSP